MSQAFPMDPPIPIDPSTIEGATILSGVSKHRDLYIFPDQTTVFDEISPEDDELAGDIANEEDQEIPKKVVVVPCPSSTPVSLV